MIANGSIFDVSAAAAVVSMIGALLGLVASALAMRVMLIHRERDTVETELEQATGALQASRSDRAIDEAIDHQFSAAREARRLEMHSAAFDRLLVGYGALFCLATVAVVVLALSQGTPLHVSVIGWFVIGLSLAALMARTLFKLSKAQRRRWSAALILDSCDLGWNSARVGRGMEISVRRWLGQQGWQVVSAKRFAGIDLTARRDGELTYWRIATHADLRPRDLDALFHAASKLGGDRPGLAIAVPASEHLPQDVMSHAAGQGIEFHLVYPDGEIRPVTGSGVVASG